MTKVPPQHRGADLLPAASGGGYTFVDGGVWANNPVMIALVDALTCFDVPRENVRILSLGCGEIRMSSARRRSSAAACWPGAISSTPRCGFSR